MSLGPGGHYLHTPTVNDLYRPHLCVVYLMVCLCNAFYVGKTNRELRQWIGDHLYYSTNSKLTTMGRHIGLYQRFKPEVIEFMVLEVVPKDPRGGDWDHLILQRETLWIKELSAIVPLSLIEVLAYKHFL